MTIGVPITSTSKWSYLGVQRGVQDTSPDDLPLEGFWEGPGHPLYPLYPYLGPIPRGTHQRTSQRVSRRVSKRGPILAHKRVKCGVPSRYPKGSNIQYPDQYHQYLVVVFTRVSTTEYWCTGMAVPDMVIFRGTK